MNFKMFPMKMKSTSLFSLYLTVSKKNFFFCEKSKTIVLMIQTSKEIFQCKSFYKFVSKQLSSPQTTDRYSLWASAEGPSITAQRMVGMTEWAPHKTAQPSRCSGRRGRQVHNFLFHRSTETAGSQD